MLTTCRQTRQRKSNPFHAAVPALLGLAMLSATLRPAVAAEPRFVQDRIAIGFWVDPPLDKDADARYADIAAANFTFVIGNFGASTREAVAQQLQLCEKYDLKALVGTAGVLPEQFPESPACWGYLLVDEPAAGAFPGLGKTVAAIRKARPGKLAYINLLPNYANAQQLGSPTYDDHVAGFIKEVNPDVLSMDYYPLFRPKDDGRDGYCGNLESMRKGSLAAGVPFWNFFNTMPFGPHSDPTEAQIRWQIYTSLAYGAKGLMYFCYWTPGGGEFPKGGAIIARDGRKTRHYDEAKRINAVIKNLGPTLMKLTSTGVVRIRPADKAGEVLKGSPLKSIATDTMEPDFLVGTFKHVDGRRAVLLNNYHFAYSAWPTVTFDADPDKVREVDPETGKEMALYDDSPDMPGLQFSLDAGQGRLFLLP